MVVPSPSPTSPGTGRPDDDRPAELRTILAAKPSGDTRVDPEARPELQRVRAAVAALADGPAGGVPARWDLLERTRWPAAGPPAGVSLQEIAATVCAPVRFETDNPYSEHRAYPSARCKFPVRLVAHEAGAAGFLIPEASGTLRVPAAPGGAPDHIETFSLPAALPSFYGPLRAVLAGLETGHVLAATALLGRALGRPLTVTGPTDGAPAWTAPLPGPALPGYRMTDDSSARPPAPPDAPTTAPTWNEVLWNRNSGRVPRGVSGFTGTHRTVTAPVWRDALAALAAGDQSLGALRAARSALGLYCWVRDVEGVEPGCHRVHFDGSAHRVGDLAAARGALLIDSAPAPGLAFELNACNLVWLLTADPGLACATSPAPAPRIAADLLAAAGWTAQHLSYAMAAHGLFARPLRSYDAELAAQALRLDAGQVPIYQLACGPGRFTEPALDVRQPPTLSGEDEGTT
ncbi:hypothetical protein OG429_17100 [Streptomyces sp. NBC_00190]|uniref:hypothetical protein n=1 Tax=Streptomyces sp. NBC_00190 TaxID=2903634 RepID=UPI002E29CFA5|nr:hypothetical protein [Streptomyces sp. NBC_00190]